MQLLPRTAQRDLRAVPLPALVNETSASQPFARQPNAGVSMLFRGPVGSGGSLVDDHQCTKGKRHP